MSGHRPGINLLLFSVDPYPPPLSNDEGICIREEAVNRVLQGHFIVRFCMAGVYYHLYKKYSYESAEF